MKQLDYKYIVTILDNQYEFSTQKEAADALGVSQGTISNALLSKGKSLIKVEKVSKTSSLHSLV